MTKTRKSSSPKPSYTFSRKIATPTKLIPATGVFATLPNGTSNNSDAHNSSSDDNLSPRSTPPSSTSSSPSLLSALPVPVASKVAGSSVPETFEPAKEMDLVLRSGPPAKQTAEVTADKSKPKIMLRLRRTPAWCLPEPRIVLRMGPQPVDIDCMDVDDSKRQAQITAMAIKLAGMKARLAALKIKVASRKKKSKARSMNKKVAVKQIRA